MQCVSAEQARQDLRISPAQKSRGRPFTMPLPFACPMKRGKGRLFDLSPLIRYLKRGKGRLYDLSPFIRSFRNSFETFVQVRVSSYGKQAFRAKTYGSCPERAQRARESGDFDAVSE